MCVAQCFPGPYGGDFYWEEFRGMFEPRWKESACCSVNLIKFEPKGEYGAIRNGLRTDKSFVGTEHLITCHAYLNVGMEPAPASKGVMGHLRGCEPRADTILDLRPAGLLANMQTMHATCHHTCIQIQKI